LSGTGKHFCAGLDLQDSLKHISNIKPTTGVSFIKNFQQCINSPVESHIPVVSISHGVSYGLALDILSATTIRFCTKDVKFSIKEIDIGIMADIGSLQRLGYLVNNQSKLNQLALTAQDFGSNEAKELGLVSDVFDSKNEAFDKALELAIAISKKYQPAVIGTKKHLELMSVNSDWTKHGLDQVARDNAKLMSDESYKKFFLGVLKKMRSKL
jgi:delta(3,5)-delta(2,4)-dienoyl-CoA isomerase